MADQPKEDTKDLITGALAQKTLGLRSPLRAASLGLGTNHLAGLLASNPFTYESKWFRGQEVLLDGYRFVNCRFDNCRLFTSRGTFSFSHCFFSGCEFTYAGDALRVVQLYNVNATEAWSRWPGLTPVKESDGTFSIP